MPSDLVPTSSGLAACAFGNEATKVFRNGAWELSKTLGTAIDLAEDGTAIDASAAGEIAPIQINGRWTPLTRTAPELPAAWKDGTAELLDTTSGGWILAKRGVGNASNYAALVPLRVEGNLQGEPNAPVNRDAAGVDSFSIGSTDPGPEVKEKIWIAAPSHGGMTHVKLRTPVHPSVPLVLSGPGLRFNGDQESLTITAPETAFTLSAVADRASGEEVPISIKFGPSESISSPIAAKVMKRRLIKVKVWRVKYDDGTPPQFNPSAGILENHLNSVFGPQINANFDCKDVQGFPEFVGPVGFDIGKQTDFGGPEPQPNGQQKPSPGNLQLDTAYEKAEGKEISRVLTVGYYDTKNINIYLVGGVSFVPGWKWEGNVAKTYFANGITDLENRRIFIAAGANKEELLNAVAHEVGHIVFRNLAHPDHEHGPFRLSPTPKERRLMCSGSKRVKDDSGHITVKGEWDEAMLWFNREIDDDRMDP